MSDEETNSRLLIENVVLLARKITRVISDQRRMVGEVNPEAEPYPLSVLGTSEIVLDNKDAGLYMKLTIEIDLLMPELADRFQHVKVKTIEVNEEMLGKLENGKRERILATVAEWERQTQLRVRFDGVVGKTADPD